MVQALLYDPYTEAFLRKAGIREGMRVLDVGSGMGDVTLLTAKLVGEKGQVVGIDTDAEVTQFATNRSREMGKDNVMFVVGDVSSSDLEGKFDAIIGRLILLHIADPVALLRQLVTHLRPGGLVAFEDIALWGTAVPACSHIDYVNGLSIKFIEQVGLDRHIGHKLPKMFQEAGLGIPKLDYFASAGSGPDWLGYEWIAEGIRTMLPVLLQFNFATEAEIDIETLEDRIREEAVTNQSVVTIPHHIGAWTNVSQQQ